MSDKEEIIAEQALGLIAQGGASVEQAALLLSRKLHVRMKRYFERHRVPSDVAEELVNDVWMKLIGSRYDGQSRPVVWLWTVAGSILLDWVSHSQARKRGGGSTEFTMDDEGWLAVEQTVPATTTPNWIRICVERAIEQLQTEDPNRAEVLRFVYEGWTAEEVATYYGAAPPIEEKHKTAARNRILEANKKARHYFAHCREE